MVKEESRVGTLPPGGSLSAQQDDGCHEGNQGEAGDAGKSDDEPDGDAETVLG